MKKTHRLNAKIMKFYCCGGSKLKENIKKYWRSRGIKEMKSRKKSIKIPVEIKHYQKTNSLFNDGNNAK